MRRRWVLALNMTLLAGLIHGSYAQEGQEPLDLIFATDDAADRAPGCDGVSVFEGETGRVQHRGDQFVSPGKLALVSDGSKVLALSTNNGGFLYGLFRGEDGRYRTRRFPIDIRHYDNRWLSGGPALVSLDDNWLYLALRRSVGRFHLPDPSDAAVARSEAESGPVTAAVILESRRGGELIVVDPVERAVRGFDPITLRDVRTPIPYEANVGNGGDELVRRTFAAIEPLGRYVVLNGGPSGRVTVIDLVDSSVSSLEADGLRETWGLTFDYARPDHLLAVHGRDRVAVYRFAGEDRLELLASESVPPQHFAWGELSRLGSLAWLAQGTGVVAAVGSAREFQVLRLTDGAAPNLESWHELDTCVPQRQENLELGFDVITLNDRRLPDPPTATSSAVPSSVPATMTPTATATRADTATPTQAAVPAIYLPLLLREQCVEESRGADTMMVLDASTSMLEEVREGWSKRDAAAEAAGRFVEMLKSGDQAGVVYFNDSAVLEQGLTDNKILLHAALARIVNRQFTRLDLGIRMARDELMGTGHNAANQAAMILLTDGKSNPEPVETAIMEARIAKDAGITVFVIGLGDRDNLDDAALRQIASRPQYYYVASDASTLAAIYEEIAGVIPCPPGTFWGRR